ncbi:MAG: prolyl oligopeptidase family serine peptidase [Acholeplasma sp.]|nr:prolyl oligopeptidase family serine peptidase [Acholeplasma sp.]
MENNIETFYFDNQKRPVLLILPGGGYEFTTWREANPVSDAFSDIGFHRAIFYYRKELLKYPNILENAKMLIEELKKDPLISDIHIMGFSAGGHLAGLLLTKYPKMFKSGILCYPVISSDEHIWHQGSFINLLVDIKDKDLVSIDKLVTKGTPPIYMWHTINDQTVPVENTYVLEKALNSNGVKNKVRLFPEGDHGLSLGTREVAFEEMDPILFEKENINVNIWVDDVKRWLIEQK